MKLTEPFLDIICISRRIWMIENLQEIMILGVNDSLRDFVSFFDLMYSQTKFYIKEICDVLFFY